MSGVFFIFWLKKFSHLTICYTFFFFELTHREQYIQYIIYYIKVHYNIDL